MTGNRSLDEFVGGAAAEGPEAEDPAPAAASDATEPAATSREPEPDAAAEPVEPDAVEPVAATVAWSPDGGECARCGERAAERWRDGDDLVCGGCKAW